MEVSVIMPALNEEANIVPALCNTLKAFEEFGIKGEIVFVNDGSTDKTEVLALGIKKDSDIIKLVKHEKPQGIGASFWDGADQANGEIVVMMPGDNENDPWEILRYYKLLEQVDIVIPFIFNKEVRSVFRNILSYLYRTIINTTFGVNFNYTNGTILYRKSLLKELDYRSSSFFFQTDILIRTVKKGYLFAEVPYRLEVREHGVSRAVSFPSLKQVVKGYLKLVKDHHFNNKSRRNYVFLKDSQTASRRESKKRINYYTYEKSDS